MGISKTAGGFFLTLAAFALAAAIAAVGGGESAYAAGNIKGSAEDGNVYSYVVSGGKATVTGVAIEKTTDYVIPESLDGFKVGAIDKYAFKGNDTMTSIVIPDSVTYIGDQAFAAASHLEKIQMPSKYNGAIGDNLFWGCEMLTEINLPEGVTSIGGWAFYNCFALESINIPSTVSSIGKYAFDHDTETGESHLRAITFAGGDLCSLTSIGSYAFKGCEALEAIELPSTVRSLGYEAFRNCKSLKTLTLPTGITTLPERAIQGCSSLEELYIYGNITEMSKNAIAFDGALRKVYFLGDISNITFTNEPFEDSFDITFYAYEKYSETLANYISEINGTQTKSAGVYNLKLENIEGVLNQLTSQSTATSNSEQEKAAAGSAAGESKAVYSADMGTIIAAAAMGLAAVCVALTFAIRAKRAKTGQPKMPATGEENEGR